MNYSTLIAAKTTAGSIKSWVNYARIDVEQIVEEAQALIYQSLRTREMRAIAAVTVVTGAISAPVPADFLDPISFKDTTNNVDLDLEQESGFLQSLVYSGGTLASGQPRRYAIANEGMLFDKKWSAGAVLGLWYYKKPASLAATTNETNFLTSRYPHLLRTACLAAAANFKSDTERYNVEAGKLAALIQVANQESDLATRGAVLNIGPVRLSLGTDRTNYAGVNTAQILKEAQLLIYQSLRTREMRAIAAINVSTGDFSASLPTGFLDPISFKDTTNNIDLDLEQEAPFLQSLVYSGGTLASGQPRRYAIANEGIVFDKRFMNDAVLGLWHYKRPTLLTLASDTNFLTERYLHLLTAACEVQLAAFRRDSAAYAAASKQLSDAIAQANQESDLATRGSVLVLGPVRLPMGPDRANYTGINCDQIIKEAQLLLYQTLRVREMREETTFTVPSGNAFWPLPADFLDPIDLYDVTNRTPLLPMTEKGVQRNRAFEDDLSIVEGVPCRYGIFSEMLQFELKYEANATLRLLYYKRPTLLTAASVTPNFLSTRYLHVLRAACEVQVESFRRDANAYGIAMQRLTALIQQTNIEADLAYRGADFDTEA